MNTRRVLVSQEALAGFCEKHGIRSLALFGSAVREDFTAESDLDLLAEFSPGEPVGYIRLGTVEAELSDLLGRPVDLNLKDSLDPAFRDQILSEAEVLYDLA